MIIHKSKNPRPFRNVNVKNLGFDYEANQSAWMLSEVFFFSDDWVVLMTGAGSSAGGRTHFNVVDLSSLFIAVVPSMIMLHQTNENNHTRILKTIKVSSQTHLSDVGRRFVARTQLLEEDVGTLALYATLHQSSG
ncbi:hypothetical protein PsorP6_015415 [Peronosclerospora sorghi]|uniref:Uncharacterized protein n=1 Tax=Peronosclerospora sorghi TaxID=230839 RepID=A0ACC0WQB9_9STRA|nr:hypothetical protein PsorP6_015415 [Peronosclerospora sorghi]